MLKSIESSKFISHKARISGKFVSKKDLHPTKLEQRPWILGKLSFREFCNSKLSSLGTFDNKDKKEIKSERLVVSSWDNDPWNNFCEPHWKLIYHNKWHAGTSKGDKGQSLLKFVCLFPVTFRVESWHQKYIDQ